jgi:hypothetical protein
MGMLFARMRQLQKEPRYSHGCGIRDEDAGSNADGGAHVFGHH